MTYNRQVHLDRIKDSVEDLTEEAKRVLGFELMEISKKSKKLAKKLLN